MFGIFKSRKPLSRSDHLILIDPKPIDYMANFAQYLTEFDEIFAHTPLGHIFVRSSSTGSTAAVVPFEANFYNLGQYPSAKAFKEAAVNNDELLPDAYIRMADVELIRKRIGDLKKEEIYIPKPYPFLGGSCAPDTYSKGGIWPFIAIVSEFLCGEGDEDNQD